ncbi:phage tail tape measure protein [Lentzea albida]|uniref:Phage-related minor tail protein n=1 Tax=Lentzea albida TaxID=65499 RepID=A0A1H9VH22_9PSEU|nr:phage tail tape measure protein [Lentzea albida]SES20869.1 Phage-related minor tail protein [Lentzea albida]
MASDTSLIFNLLAKDKTGSGFDSMVAGAAAAGIGIGAALTASVAGALDQEKVTAKLSAQLGGGPWAAEAGGVAASLYKDALGSSLADTSNAVQAVASSIKGLSSASDLEDVTAKAINFATAFDEDVSMSVANASTLIGSGLAKDATHAFDLMTAASQKVPAALRADVSEAAHEYSQFFHTLGFSGEQAFGLLVNASAKGKYGIDKTGDAIKEFTLRATDMSTKSQEAYKVLGLNAGEMANAILAGGDKAQGAYQKVVQGLTSIKDPATQANTAIALFGTPLEDLNVGEIPAFLANMANVGSGLGDVSGSVSRLGETLNNNASTNIQSFMNQVQMAFVEIVGGKVLPIVSDVASFLASNFGPALSAAGDILTGKVIPAVTSFAQWLNENRVPITIVAGLIAGLFIPHLIALGVTQTVTAAKSVAAWAVSNASAIAAAVVHSGQILMMIGKWVLLGTQSLLQAGRMALAWVIAMGPVGWVIAAVIGLVTLIVVYWDEIVAATKAAWQWVSDAVSAAIDWVVSFVRDNWQLLISIVLGPLGIIIALVVTYWDQIVAAVRAGVNWVLDAVAWLGSLPGRAAAWFGGLVSAAGAKIGELVEKARSIPGMILSALGNLGSMLYESGASLLRGLVNGFMSMVQTVKNKVSGALQEVRNLFPFSPAKEGPFSGKGWVTYSGQSIASALGEGITSRAEVAVSAARQLASSTREGLQGEMGTVGPAPLAPVGAGGGGGQVVLRIESSGSRMDDFLVELLRKYVRVNGGDVQTVLGR